MPSAMPPTQEEGPVQEDRDLHLYNTTPAPTSSPDLSYVDHLPTQAEYLAALSSDRRKPVSSEDLEDCAICYCPTDGQEVVETICKHIFCYGCANTWFEQSNTCPCCREELYEKSAEETNYEISWAEYEESRIDAFDDLFMSDNGEGFFTTGYEELGSFVEKMEKMNVRLAEEYPHKFMPFEEAEVRQLFEASERSEDYAVRFLVRGPGVYDMASRAGKNQWAQYEQSRNNAFDDLLMSGYGVSFFATGYEELSSFVEKMNERLEEEYPQQFMPFDEAAALRHFEFYDSRPKCAGHFLVRGSTVYHMASRTGRDQYDEDRRTNALGGLLSDTLKETLVVSGYEELSSIVERMNVRLEEDDAYRHQFMPFQEAEVLQMLENISRGKLAGHFLIVGSGVYYMRSQTGVDQYVKRETEARKRRLAASDFLRKGYRVPVGHVALRLNRSLNREYLWLKKADVIKFVEDIPNLEVIGDFVHRVEDLEDGLFDYLYRVEDVEEGLFAMGL